MKYDGRSPIPFRTFFDRVLQNPEMIRQEIQQQLDRLGPRILRTPPVMKLRSDLSSLEIMRQAADVMMSSGQDAAYNYIDRVLTSTIIADPAADEDSRRRRRIQMHSAGLVLYEGAHFLTRPSDRRVVVLTPTALRELLLLAPPVDVLVEGLPNLPAKRMLVILPRQASIEEIIRSNDKIRKQVDRSYREIAARTEALRERAANDPDNQFPPCPDITGRDLLSDMRSMTSILAFKDPEEDRMSLFGFHDKGRLSSLSDMCMIYGELDPALSSFVSAAMTVTSRIVLNLAMCFEDRITEEYEVGRSDLTPSRMSARQKRKWSADNSPRPYTLVNISRPKRKPRITDDTEEIDGRKLTRGYQMANYWNYYWVKDPGDATVHGRKNTEHGPRHKVRLLVSSHWRGPDPEALEDEVYTVFKVTADKGGGVAIDVDKARRRRRQKSTTAAARSAERRRRRR